MAYRFAPASNPFIEISGGAIVGDNLGNTSSGGWTVAVGGNRNGTGSWQGLCIQTDGSTEKFYVLELTPANVLTVDNTVTSVASSTALTNTTDDTMFVFSWDGTDNVTDNARFSWKVGAAAWQHEYETWDSFQTSGAAGNMQSGWRFRIGNNVGTSDDLDADLYAWGFRLGGRSQAEIEALSLGAGGYATWQTMFDVSDSILHRFDDIGTLTDQTGLGADETSRSASGITLVADPTDFYSSGSPYIGAGAAATATSGNVTAANPAGATTNDIQILDITALDNVDCSVANAGGSGSSWTRKIAQNNGAGLRKEIWWRRRAGGDTDTGATVTHTGGGKIIAQQHLYRIPSAPTTGDPFEAVGGPTNVSAASSGTFPNVTSLSTNAELFYSLGYAEDFSTGPSISNAQGLTLTERAEVEVT